jgi:hypothetical protein
MVRFSFWFKIAITFGLVQLFDSLFPDSFAGAAVGAFALSWIVGVVLGRRDVRRNRRAWIAIAAAGLFALALFDEPGPLAWTLFWSALSIAALIPHAARFDDAWTWALRLIPHAFTAISRPLGDLARLHRCRRSLGGTQRMVQTLALPVIGGALFVALFAAANPLIADRFATIRLPSPWQLLLWVFVACCVWPSLRPASGVMRLAPRLSFVEPVLPGTSLPSVLIALAVFNLIFAVQNGLDIVFLWSGGSLPAGMTQTEYVHRGAYPLIVTALIAGALSLAMLRPGSAGERDPWARRLVVLWVAQNLVLVASSMLRTIDYIEASMLTGWRIAALLWMGLVALGLVLICWRILKGRSGRWLVNANALAAAIVLTACSFVDLGAIAASWNVRAKTPDAIDLCYLRSVGDGALLPLIELEHRPMDAATRDRVRSVREQLFTDLDARQASWSHWTPRGDRRLDEARRRLGPNPPGPQPVVRGSRNCDGSIYSLQQP